MSHPKSHAGRRRTRAGIALVLAGFALATVAFSPLAERAGADETSVPGAPSSVAVTTPVNPTTAAVNPDQADPASATVSWNAPTTGGAPSSYTVSASPGGLTCTTTTTSCEVTGLATTTPYTFAVVATNAAGASVSADAPDTVVVATDFTAVASPTTNLLDGDPVAVTITRTVPALNIRWVFPAWCPSGVSLPATISDISSINVLNEFSGPSGGYCAEQTTLSAATVPAYGPISPLTNAAQDYPTVSGTVIAEVGSAVSLPAGNPPTPAVQCGPDNPCDLGLAVEVVSPITSYYDLAIPLSFTTPDIITACNGTDASPIETAGPDYITSAWVNWTIGTCQSGAVDGNVAPTDNEAVDESLGVQLFSEGTTDLAYSAVGYGAPGFSQATNRPYVAVPIGINAAVFANGGGHDSNSVAGQNVLTPINASSPPLKLTYPEAAYLLSACRPVSNSPEGTAFYATNNLTPDGGVPLTQEPTSQYGFYAESGGSAMTDFTTSLLEDLAPADVDTGTPCANNPTDAPLSATSDFGTASPPWNVAGYTGATIFTKDLTPTNSEIWALTDVATAAQTWNGLDDVALQSLDSVGSATPTFVLPTQATMDAAVAQMLPQPDGTLLPNPNAVAVGGVEPYPLTFVEYALAPAEPLLNADCSANTTEQSLLTKWLSYITGPSGQAELPAGMEPLTASLASTAQTRIAEVGQSAITGTCATPDAPTNVTGTAGDGTVSLSWSAPSDTGAAVSDYKILVTPAGGSPTTIDTGSTSTTYQVTGLTDGTSYTFEVEAVNATGTGPPSVPSGSITPSATPGSTTTTTTPGTTTTTPGGTTGTATGTTGPTLPPITGGSAFGAAVSATVAASSPTTLTDSASGADVSVFVPSGALPTGTVVELIPVTDSTALASALPASKTYIVAFDVAWQAPDGSSPDATAPIFFQVTDPAVDVGDTVYAMTGPTPTEIGTTTTAGGVTIPFESDPIFIIAGPTPPAAGAPSLLGAAPGAGTPSSTGLSTLPPPSPSTGGGGQTSPGLVAPTSTPVALTSVKIPAFAGSAASNWITPTGEAIALVFLLGGMTLLAGGGALGRRRSESTTDLAGAGERS